MVLLKVLFCICALSCFQRVISEEGVLQAATLPSQCDNSVIELAPIVYVAVGINYTNCTLRGQVGTVVQGALDRLCDHCHSGHTTASCPFNSGVTTLSGSMLLDHVSLKAASLRINGDDVTVRNSNISTYGFMFTQDDQVGFVVSGGRATFKGTHVQSIFRTYWINTSLAFFSSDVSPASGNAAVVVSGSTISLENSAISVEDDQQISLKSSTATLSNSSFQTGHGPFVMMDSNATLTRSHVIVLMGSQGISIGNSSIIADCDSSAGAVFGIEQGNSGPGISIDSSRLTFHNCSCDIGSAIKIDGLDTSFGGINMEASSVHFEGCMTPRTVYPIVV